jgi:ethanolamine permease
MNQNEGLKKTLTPFMLWGLGVGYVISGMYFGWNLGLEKGGTLGMAIATAIIMLMYVTFSFSYAELACAIPKAGGVFDYAQKALGKNTGFFAGMAQSVEFIFAPPAIAFAIGAYFNSFFPQIPVLATALTSYVLFTALNIYGIKEAASFATTITIIAIMGLVLFYGLALPSFKSENLFHNSFPNGWQGAFAAIPFAIWFFLGIEGVANVAEESQHPQKDISRGFGLAMTTLIILCVLVFVLSIGIDGWEAIVYKNGVSGETTDSPLPLALSKIKSEDVVMTKMFTLVGLSGLIASFHGLLLAAGRSTFEMGRTKQLPFFLGKVSKKFKTPAHALLINMIIGMIALLTGRTTDIITISVFGALTLYIISMISLFALRKKHPELHRPFRVPLYPLFPFITLVIAVISLAAMCIYNFSMAIAYFLLLAIAFVLYKIFRPNENEQETNT